MAETLVAPKITIPGSPEWMKWRIGGARQGAVNIASDSRPFINAARDLQEHRAWEIYFDDEPKTWERFCREILNTEPEFVALIDEGVRVLEHREYEGPITKEMAIAAAAEKAPELPRHGGDRKVVAVKQGANSTLKRGSTDAQYLTARIKRDRPDILEKMKAGEYKSVRAAARDAGIVKELSTIDKMQRLWRKLGADEQEQFLVWVSKQ